MPLSVISWTVTDEMEQKDKCLKLQEKETSVGYKKKTAQRSQREKGPRRLCNLFGDVHKHTWAV